MRRKGGVCPPLLPCGAEPPAAVTSGDAACGPASCAQLLHRAFCLLASLWRLPTFGLGILSAVLPPPLFPAAARWAAVGTRTFLLKHPLSTDLVF